jgi:hypothetical protein
MHSGESFRGSFPIALLEHTTQHCGEKGNCASWEHELFYHSASLNDSIVTSKPSLVIGVDIFYHQISEIGIIAELRRSGMASGQAPARAGTANTNRVPRIDMLSSSVTKHA